MNRDKNLGHRVGKSRTSLLPDMPRPLPLASNLMMKMMFIMMRMISIEYEDVGVDVSAVTGDTPSVQGDVVTAEQLLVPSHQDLLLKAVGVIIQPGDVLVVAGDLLPGQVEAVQHSLLHHQSVELRPQQSLLAGTALRLVK